MRVKFAMPTPRMTKIFAFQDLESFALGVHMAFPGVLAQGRILHHLEAKLKAGKEEPLPHKTGTSQADTKVPSGWIE